VGLVTDVPFHDLCYKLNGLAMQVHNQLGPGHKEVTYQNALADKIRQADLAVEVEKQVEIYVGESLVGLLYIDLFVENAVVVECKAFPHLLTDEDTAQVITYLGATGQPVGMLYNFGRKKLDFHRIFPPKQIQAWQERIRRYVYTPPGAQAIRVEIPDPMAKDQAGAEVLRNIERVAPMRAKVPFQSESSVHGQSQVSSYADAGVDIDRKMGAIERMKAFAKATYTPAVLAGIGNFGGLFDAGALQATKAPVLVASTDGVGTKTKIAAAMGRCRGLGHDIVNHCINDILVQGAHPLFFLDYIASSVLDPDMLVECVAGCAEACAEAGCALLGGETAEMPGVYAPGEFDLVGTLVGWVERDEIVDGRDVRPGDVCVGLPSSGLHTNGYSLARKVFVDIPWDKYVDSLGTTLGESLLVIHRSYLKPVDNLQKLGITIKAMAHITGGGFPDNLPRVIPEGVGVKLDRGAWEPLPIFDLIQEQGGVDALEMYRVFNMGMGMVLFLAPGDADRAIAALADAFPEGPPRAIGEVIAWDGSGDRVRL